MRNFFTNAQMLVLIVFGTALPTAVYAQAYPSILWEIKNGEVPQGFLLGTMHSGDSAVYAQIKEFAPYLDKCEVFSGELDFDDAMSQSQMGQINLFMTDTVLSDLFSEEDYAFLAKELSERWPSESMMSETMMPFWTSTFLTLDFESESMNQALDLELHQMAKDSGMIIKPLETALEQVRAIESIPLRIQAEMLLDLVINFEEQQQLMRTLPELYAKQDLQALHDLYAADEFPGAMHEALVTKRNYLMVERLSVLMSGSEKVFCAVGALHLPGTDGMIELMRSKGFEVSPVFISH